MTVEKMKIESKRVSQQRIDIDAIDERKRRTQEELTDMQSKVDMYYCNQWCRQYD